MSTESEAILTAGGGWRLLEVLHRRAILPNAAALLIIAIHILCVLAAGRVLGFEVALDIYRWPLFVFVPLSLFLMLLAASLFALVRQRPVRPITFLRDKFVDEWKVGERILLGLPVFIAMPFMFSAFTSFKAAIGKAVPFHADAPAMAIDAMLHGADPWRLLQPVLGFPIVTSAISFLYNLWFFVIYSVLAFAVFIVSSRRLRSRYLVAFVLSWAIIGNLLAMLLSSAGPCYFSEFHSTDPYGGLIAYLDEVRRTYPLWAREAQAFLLQQYQTQSAGLGAGISAMPSMHVAIAVLNAMFLAQFGRVVGIAAWLFALLIFVGSVHLGWHYAIDGYVAAPLAVAIWKFADWLVAPRESPAALSRPA